MFVTWQELVAKISGWVLKADRKKYWMQWIRGRLLIRYTRLPVY